MRTLVAQQLFAWLRHVLCRTTLLYKVVWLNCCPCGRTFTWALLVKMLACNAQNAHENTHICKFVQNFRIAFATNYFQKLKKIWLYSQNYPPQNFPEFWFKNFRIHFSSNYFQNAGKTFSRIFLIVCFETLIKSVENLKNSRSLFPKLFPKCRENFLQNFGRIYFHNYYMPEFY